MSNYNRKLSVEQLLNKWHNLNVCLVDDSIAGVYEGRVLETPIPDEGLATIIIASRLPVEERIITFFHELFHLDSARDFMAWEEYKGKDGKKRWKYPPISKRKDLDWITKYQKLVDAPIEREARKIYARCQNLVRRVNRDYDLSRNA